ncbi:MAG TPA: MFS transporter [Vicinamibacterales bacterium]|nr:MFS transporter [Vicinamibacterales bacterium]
MHDWRRNQAALMIASFVGFTGFTLVMPFLALRFQGLGVDDTREVALWTGFTLGVTPAVAAACAPLWGRVGDRFGNKLLVQRSLFFCVFVMTLMGLATEPWQLFVLRALQGLVAGYGPLTIAMAAESAPREKMAHAIGLVQTAQRVAPAVGPVIGGVLAQAVGLRNSFFVAGAVYALAFALVSVLYRDTGHAAREAERRTHVPMLEILSIRNLLLLMGVIFGLQLTERSLGPVLLLHVEALGYARAALLVGVLFSLLSVAGALGHQIAASALARAPARRVIATAIVAAALGLAVFTVTSAAWALMGGILAVGVGVGVAMTAAFTAAGASIPRHVHSTSFGFLTGASLTGTAVGPVLGGLVAARSITAVFVLGVVILAGLAVIVRRVMTDAPLGQVGQVGKVSQVSQVGDDT